MPLAIERRKARFLRALATQRLTQAGFAAANGITKGHLSQVVNGKRESESLWSKIDAFAEKHLAKQQAIAS